MTNNTSNNKGKFIYGKLENRCCSQTIQFFLVRMWPLDKLKWNFQELVEKKPAMPANPRIKRGIRNARSLMIMDVPPLLTFSAILEEEMTLFTASVPADLAMEVGLVDSSISPT